MTKRKEMVKMETKRKAIEEEEEVKFLYLFISLLDN